MTRTANWLFPIDNAEQYLRGFNKDVERVSSVIRWPSFDGVTELRIEDLQKTTMDGLVVSEMVTITHTSPVLQALPPEMAPHLNKWASLSTLVPAQDNTLTRLVCKVGIFSTDRPAAEQNYAPLICTEAAVIGWHAARMARGEFRVDPDLSPLTMTDQPPPFDSADFEALLDMTNRRGFLGSLGNRHYTVEFPWDPGSVSQSFSHEDVRDRARRDLHYSAEDLERMGGRTSLLQILVSEHPLYGRGIQSRLEIPIPVNDPAVFRLVDELNRWELSGPDLPPLFGAWCLGDRAPAFVTFVPTQMCFPGLLQNLTAWAIVRQQRVRQWITSAGSIQ